MIANAYRIGYTKLHNKVHIGLNTMACNSNRSATDIIDIVGSGRYLFDIRVLYTRHPEYDWCAKCIKVIA